jgi:methyltransferase (TIGR00027 family)
MFGPVAKTRSRSRTAVLVAACRGRHSAKEHALIHDKWALQLAGEEGAELADKQEPLYPHFELWVAVRSAYIDAHVAMWAGSPHEFKQIVVLGAGLDMRAFRLAKEGVRFFEVDHPASQADKIARLAEAQLHPNHRATYVTCDFEHQSFMDELLRADFDTGAPALIIWEGVTPYLPEATVKATLHAIALRCHTRSIVIFDHLLKKVMARTRAERKEEEADKEDTQSFVDALGEKVVWGTNDVLPLLYESGFRHVRSLSFDEACLTLTGTYAREREFRFQRIAWASVTPPQEI